MERVDPVVQEEGLSAAVGLALDRAGDQLLVERADVGADRAAPLRRRLDHRDVAQAGEAHLQGPRDRRGRQREHVDLELELAQQLLLADAEALLLVDHQQPEVGRADVAAEQAVGADQDVDLAVGEAGEDVAHLGRLAQPRDHLDLDRELAQALAEGAEVLLGEDRRRDEHHHLLRAGDGLQRGAHRHLGLAVADVAADQPVHRARRLHVLADRLDRLQLVRRLAVGERALQLLLPVGVGLEGVARAGPALRVEGEQLSRQLAGGPARPRLDGVPALRAERRQLRRVAARARRSA